MRLKDERTPSAMPREIHPRLLTATRRVQPAAREPSGKSSKARANSRKRTRSSTSAAISACRPTS